MKTTSRLVTPLLLLFGLGLLGGCALVAESAMHSQNEKDLTSGRQSTAEYRQRRDQIDQAFKD